MTPPFTSCSPLVIRFKHNSFSHHFSFEAYGVKIGISANSAEGLTEIKKLITSALPKYRSLDENDEVDHRFIYSWNPSGRDSYYKNGERITGWRRRDVALEWLMSDIRLTAGENAVGRIFVHAGVVAWKGKAIVMPAHSMRGKSSLTAALIERGAVYYSDEYAIFDAQGYVHPFTKDLSIRGDLKSRRQIDYPAEAFGAVAATERAPVGMILLTEYGPRARWKPRILTAATGLLEMIRYTLPIRRDPKFTLTVLQHIAKNNLIIKTKRPDAKDAVDRIIELFERKVA
ncbi:MAG TPA: hypothetical protein VJL58_11795 [Pyrinomonadaceae bacterium]|nr:hypothetical protein [Pyrinomonadaceae bacterium]